MNLIVTKTPIQPRTSVLKRNISFSLWKRPSAEITTPKEERDITQPFKFLKSGAANTHPRAWRYEYCLQSQRNIKWHHKAIVKGAVALFCVYLLYVRKGNDIDYELAMPLGQRVLLLKERDILDLMKTTKKKSEEYKKLEKDLAEVNELRVKYGYDMKTPQQYMGIWPS